MRRHVTGSQLSLRSIRLLSLESDVMLIHAVCIVLCNQKGGCKKLKNTQRIYSAGATVDSNDYF